MALLGIQALDQKLAALQGSLTGNVTASALSVYAPSNFSGDSVGEAKILAGETSVRVTFRQAYAQQPIITFSPEGAAIPAFIGEKDSTGFTLAIPSPTSTDVTFDWHSFASPDEQLTVSDGTTQNITLVVARSSPSGTLPSISVAGSGSASEADPEPAPLPESATSTAAADPATSTPATDTESPAETTTATSDSAPDSEAASSDAPTDSSASGESSMSDLQTAEEPVTP